MRNVAIRERQTYSHDDARGAAASKDPVAAAFLSYSSYHFGADD